jgi:hypothetical protein
LDQHPLPKPEDENNTNSVDVEVKRDLQKAWKNDLRVG